MFDNNTIVYGKEYATNSEGEGLFCWDERRGQWAQILGTCQFSVKKVKDKQGKIRRTVKNKYYKYD